ncbi:hypothetical protein OsJ_35743 [Oryza sativa Japonica Group]|uniref:Uncharacterized protein n=1 Tax=Oryza sativa subsp. japonica TaxID=39947 RepID=A3CGD1_ORYSJ|nr:hypothetical protein OsJ_35743 [Oryza sativa Japonica Group]
MVPELELDDDEDDSGSDCETDSEDDRRRGYRRPVPQGGALRVIYNGFYFRCLVCPGKMASRWNSMEDIKNHTVGKANSSSLREENKKWQRHGVLARNEGWMPA